MSKDYKNELVFKFQDDDVKGLITYNLRLLSRIGKSFDFVYDKLVKLGHGVSGDNPQLSTDKFMEGKNYHWSSILAGDVKMLFRQYGSHLTVYTCHEKPRSMKLKNGKTMEWTENKYGSFTFYPESNKITKKDVDFFEDIEEPSDDVKYISDYYSDYLYDDPFYVFNKYIGQIIELVRDDKLWLVSNSCEVEVPDFVEIKDVFNGESMYSIDKLIFCAEEISNIHMMLFAETEMIEAIKGYKVGDTFGEGFEKGEITEISTTADDGYYHSAGLKMNLEHNGEEKWIDVYSLTQWYIRYVFPNKETNE